MPQPDVSPFILCAACGRQVAPAALRASKAPEALCLRCLRKRPGATFAQRLVACRLAAGLTTGQVAARVGGSENTILRYESGRQQPRPTRLAALAQLFGRDLLGAP